MLFRRSNPEKTLRSENSIDGRTYFWRDKPASASVQQSAMIPSSWLMVLSEQETKKVGKSCIALIGSKEQTSPPGEWTVVQKLYDSFHTCPKRKISQECRTQSPKIRMVPGKKLCISFTDKGASREKSPGSSILRTIRLPTSTLVHCQIRTRPKSCFFKSGARAGFSANSKNLRLSPAL